MHGNITNEENSHKNVDSSLIGYDIKERIERVVKEHRKNKKTKDTSSNTTANSTGNTSSNKYPLALGFAYFQ